MDQCGVFREVHGTNFVVGYLLAVGILGSYVPQHLKVVRRRSSEGLSPVYLLFGSISAVSALGNVVILTGPARSCCGELTFLQCTNSLISLAQIAMQCMGSCLVLVLCVYITRDSVIEYRQDFKDLVTYYHWVGIYLVFCVVVSVGMTVLGFSLVPFANALGIVSTSMALVQFFPQLLTTYRAQHAGTLSIPSMLIQTPGGLFWSWSLWAQPNSSWSTYLPFLTSALLQGTLLMMCLYFQATRNTELGELAADEANASVNAASADESTTLL